jgi:hypothetical protein
MRTGGGLERWSAWGSGCMLGTVHVHTCFAVNTGAYSLQGCCSVLFRPESTAMTPSVAEAQVPFPSGRCGWPAAGTRPRRVPALKLWAAAASSFHRRKPCPASTSAHSHYSDITGNGSRPSQASSELPLTPGPRPPRLPCILRSNLYTIFAVVSVFFFLPTWLHIDLRCCRGLVPVELGSGKLGALDGEPANPES